MRLNRTALCVLCRHSWHRAPRRPHAQVAQRRAASPAALLAYPGFYQGQLVVVRGNLVTRDQPVLLSPSIERSIPLIFSGPSPVDGPVELRASFWDVGRLQREDPRIATLGLDRLLPRGLEGDWPRPGEVIALTVTDAMAVKPSEGAPSLRQIALDPSAYVGQRVKVVGTVSRTESVRRCAAGTRPQPVGLRAPQRGRGRLDYRPSTSRQGLQSRYRRARRHRHVARNDRHRARGKGSRVDRRTANRADQADARDAERGSAADSADGSAARSDFQRPGRRRNRRAAEGAHPPAVLARDEPRYLQGERALDVHRRRCRQRRRQHASRSRPYCRASNTTARSARSRFS